MGSNYKFLGFIYNPAPCCQSTSGTPTKSTKNVDELADEVIAGKWGNGQDRINRLTTAGYDAAAVQSAVNDKLAGKTTAQTTAKKSNEEIAKEVVAGKWGNGGDRKNALTAAGYDYAAIQAIVNKIV